MPRKKPVALPCTPIHPWASQRADENWKCQMPSLRKKVDKIGSTIKPVPGWVQHGAELPGWGWQREAQEAGARRAQSSAVKKAGLFSIKWSILLVKTGRYLNILVFAIGRFMGKSYLPPAFILLSEESLFQSLVNYLDYLCKPCWKHSPDILSLN